MKRGKSRCPANFTNLYHLDPSCIIQAWKGQAPYWFHKTFTLIWSDLNRLEENYSKDSVMFVFTDFIIFTYRRIFSDRTGNKTENNGYFRNCDLMASHIMNGAFYVIFAKLQSLENWSKRRMIKLSVSKYNRHFLFVTIFWP